MHNNEKTKKKNKKHLKLTREKRRYHQMFNMAKYECANQSKLREKKTHLTKILRLEFLRMCVCVCLHNLFIHRKRDVQNGDLLNEMI